MIELKPVGTSGYKFDSPRMKRTYFDFLDMEGVRGSSPRASTTLSTHKIKSIALYRRGSLDTPDRHSFALFCLWGFTKCGTKGVHAANAVFGVQEGWEPSKSLCRQGNAPSPTKHIGFSGLKLSQKFMGSPDGGTWASKARRCGSTPHEPARYERARPAAASTNRASHKSVDPYLASLGIDARIRRPSLQISHRPGGRSISEGDSRGQVFY